MRKESKRRTNEEEIETHARSHTTGAKIKVLLYICEMIWSVKEYLRALSLVVIDCCCQHIILPCCRSFSTHNLSPIPLVLLRFMHICHIVRSHSIILHSYLSLGVCFHPIFRSSYHYRLFRFHFLLLHHLLYMWNGWTESGMRVQFLYFFAWFQFLLKSSVKFEKDFASQRFVCWLFASLFNRMFF